MVSRLAPLLAANECKTLNIEAETKSLRFTEFGWNREDINLAPIRGEVFYLRRL